MKSVILPYGNSGWLEKSRYLEALLNSRPNGPFLYNDVLILVPSARMKRRYGRLFLDLVERKGSAALVPPEIQTLYQFFEKNYARLDGPRLMDENSRLVLLEGLVKERLGGGPLFHQSPDLLAPSLSAAIAKMIEQLSGAGVGPDELRPKIKDAEFFDKPQVRLLLDVYSRYRAELQKHNVTDPAGMRSLLADHFEAAWLPGYNEIVIDGIQDAGALEALILRKVAACGNCTCLAEAASVELLDHADEFHPLRDTRDFLAAVGVSLEGDSVVLKNDDLFLARTLFSDEPFGEATENAPGPVSFSKRMELVSAINTREEVTFIAGRVKKSLRGGTVPDSVLVAFPSLDEYGPLVEELFTDYGIPYNRALGRQLGAAPVTTAVVSLLRACQEDFSGPSLLRIFSSPFLKFAGNKTLAHALDRLMREKKITGGKEKLLAALGYPSGEEKAASILSGPLNDLFTALEPFSGTGPAALSQWMERLDDLMRWSGLGPRVDLIHGPLNVNLQAFKKLNDTLASLGRAGRLFPEYSYSFSEWLFLLKKTFMHARFQVPPEDEGGVQVLGIEESIGHPWKEIYLGGLVDGKFPQRLPQNIFLPERTLETMGVRTLERARMNAAGHFYRLLLSADTVVLTWPENEGDRPVTPSPFLEELVPLKTAGLLNRGVEKTSGIQFSLRVEDSGSVPELAKAIGLSGEFPGLREISGANLEGMPGIRSAVGHQPEKNRQGVIPPAKREFRVTELDEYLACPYDYYVKYVLGIEPLEEATEDTTPLDRGSKVHAVLRNFYLSWNKPVARGSRDEARALLRTLADSAFNGEADTFRNRREKERFLTIMAERFLDAEEEFWKQGMKPGYLEQKIERFPLVLSNGDIVELSARIDRIDVDDKGGFMIVDYKTGKYPLPKMNVEQEIFQLPIYAVMAQTGVKGKGPVLKRPIGLAYYDLAGKTGAGARDVVLFDKDARDDHPSSKPKASPKSAGDFKMILQQSMEKARKAVEAILAGAFSSTPQDENKCRTCANEAMCEKKEP